MNLNIGDVLFFLYGTKTFTVGKVLSFIGSDRVNVKWEDDSFFRDHPIKNIRKYSELIGGVNNYTQNESHIFKMDD